MKKSNLITWGIIVGVIIFAFIIMYKPTPETPDEVAKCIGEKSILYVQLGCPHCESQEELFGNNLDKITIIDCFYEREKCQGIEATPTWVIGTKKITGVQTIEELQKLTGC